MSKTRIYIRFDETEEIDLQRKAYLEKLKQRREMQGFIAFAIDLAIAVRERDDLSSILVGSDKQNKPDSDDDKNRSISVNSEPSIASEKATKTSNRMTKLKGFHKV